MNFNVSMEGREVVVEIGELGIVGRFNTMDEAAEFIQSCIRHIKYF